MSIRFRIDPHAGILISEFEGPVNSHEILAWYEVLRGHEDFRADIRQLADFRRNEPVAWTPDEMKRVIRTEPFGPGAQRAFVGPDDLVYGLARMYASYSESMGQGGEIRPFRTMAEAAEWLGLEESATEV